MPCILFFRDESSRTAMCCRIILVAVFCAANRSGRSSTSFAPSPRMEESAMVDGADRQAPFIHYPSVEAGIITATTLSFIFSWNNFMFSQVLSMEKTKTLPIAVYNSDFGAEVTGAAWMLLRLWDHGSNILTMISETCGSVRRCGVSQRCESPHSLNTS